MNECTANGGVVCDPNALIASNPLVNMRPVYNFPYPSQNTFFWTNANCTQMVKVRQDGMMCVAMCKLLVSRLLYFSYSTFVRFFYLQSDHSQTSVSPVIMFCSSLNYAITHHRNRYLWLFLERILISSTAREFMPRPSTS
jgi:hypothetical protein